MPIVVLASPDMTRVSEAITCKSLDAESRVASFRFQTFLSLLRAAQDAISHTTEIDSEGPFDMTQYASSVSWRRGTQVMRWISRVGGIVVERIGLAK